MRFISFQKVEKKFLIPMIGGIISLTYEYIVDIIPKKERMLQNPFIKYIYGSLGMVFAFIPYLILKYRTRKSTIYKINSDKEQDESKLSIELIYEDTSEEINSNNKNKYILISSIFDFLYSLLFLLFCLKCIYNLWVFDFIFISIFSNLIQKTKIYKHQYISMITIILLGLGLNIIEYFKIDENKENKINLLEIMMKLLTESFF